MNGLCQWPYSERYNGVHSLMVFSFCWIDKMNRNYWVSEFRRFAWFLFGSWIPCCSVWSRAVAIHYYHYVWGKKWFLKRIFKVSLCSFVCTRALCTLACCPMTSSVIYSLCPCISWGIIPSRLLASVSIQKCHSYSIGFRRIWLYHVNEYVNDPQTFSMFCACIRF